MRLPSGLQAGMPEEALLPALTRTGLPPLGVDDRQVGTPGQVGIGCRGRVT